MGNSSSYKNYSAKMALPEVVFSHHDAMRISKLHSFFNYKISASYLLIAPHYRLRGSGITGVGL